MRLSVARIVVEGATALATAELEALGSGLIGRQVSLQEVYDLAARITAKYGDLGYVLSRAIIPPQELKTSGAVIRIRVVEGYIDRVEWPRSLERYRDFFTDYSARITAARPINVKIIERYLLLANDLPGLSFRSTLKPSETNPSAATLVIEATEKPFSAAARVDNRGTAARGPVQFGATVGAANVLGWHESAAISFATTADTRELRYIAGDFRTVLTSEGLAAFFSPYLSTGRPGTAVLRSLGYHSKAAGGEAGFSYPLIRSRDENLVLSAMAFLTDSTGDLDAGRLSQDRLRGGRIRAAYDMADRFGGISQAVATFSQGVRGLGSTVNGALLASRAVGRVDFSKVDLLLSRSQPIGAGFSLFGLFEGQYAFSSLLASEQCGYGGSRIGRAFDPSALLGDSCWAILGELRYDIPHSLPDVTQAQAYAFADHGQVFVRDAALGTQSRQLGSSAGAGLRMAWNNRLNGSFEIARQFQGPDNKGWRAFFSIGATY